MQFRVIFNVWVDKSRGHWPWFSSPINTYVTTCFSLLCYIALLAVVLCPSSFYGFIKGRMDLSAFDLGLGHQTCFDQHSRSRSDIVSMPSLGPRDLVCLHLSFYSSATTKSEPYVSWRKEAELSQSTDA